MIKNNTFGVEQQEKILKRYVKYYNSKDYIWNMPLIEMKNILHETWNLSKILTKHKDSVNLIDKIKEDFEDIENLYDSIDKEENIFDIKEKLQIHLKLKKKRFKEILIK